MGGRIVGTRETTIEQSFYNHAEKQWYHVARYFRHALHSTKGWRKSGTTKLITKISQKYAIREMRVTQKFTRTA